MDFPKPYVGWSSPLLLEWWDASTRKPRDFFVSHWLMQDAIRLFLRPKHMSDGEDCLMDAMLGMDVTVVICHTRVSPNVGIEVGDTWTPDVVQRMQYTFMIVV